jgi:hypothetical protein
LPFAQQTKPSFHRPVRFETCRMHDGSKSADPVIGIVPNISLRE